MAADFLWASARKDLLRRARDRLALVLWVGIPLVIGSLIFLVSGGAGGAIPRARVLIADHDDSFVSGLLSRALRAGPEQSPFEGEIVDEAEGRAQLEAGEGSALLVIPTGFSRALLDETSCELLLVTNPAQRILPRMVEEALSIVVDGVFYTQRLVDEELRREIRRFANGPPDDLAVFPEGEVTNFSVRVNRVVERLSKTLFPPVIRLETSPEATQEEGPDFGQLYFPSMFFMAFFFVAQGLSEDLWKEKAQGTLRRLLTSPRSFLLFLGGKLLAAALVVGAVCLAGLGFGAAAFEFALARLPLVWLFGTLVGTALVAAMMLIQLLASGQRAGHLLTNLVLFPAIMIGGAFFPFEAMPDWMARIGRATPNGWALEELKAMLGGHAGGARAGADLVLVALALAGLAGLCALRMRGRFARG